MLHLAIVFGLFFLAAWAILLFVFPRDEDGDEGGGPPSPGRKSHANTSGGGEGDGPPTRPGHLTE